MVVRARQRKITLWDSWLRRDSLKAIGRTFGKPSLLFIAGWPPVLRRPVEITVKSGRDALKFRWGSALPLKAYKREELSRRLHSAARNVALAFAGCGAPTRSRRSESDKAPPANMIPAPSQINKTCGLK